MCGIFACKINKTSAAQITLEALQTLEYRGYDSWGVVALVESGELKVEKHTGKIGVATLNLPTGQAGSQLATLNSHIAIGHTRWATHGGVSEINAHPHLSCDGRFAVVHNGIVENFDELQKELASKGHIFTSQTDTEVIAHLVEELSQTMDTTEAVRTAFLSLRGLNAFVILDSKSGEIFTVKNGSPLIIGRGENNEGYLASDTVALAPHTKTIYYVCDQEMVIFSERGIKLFDTTTGREKEIKWETLAYDAKMTQLGKFKHFLHKEICEQPEILRKISKSKIQISNMMENKRIWFVGCGSAGYAGLFGQYIFTQNGVDARAVAGSEFGEYIDAARGDDLVLYLSQSGETIDLIETAKVLKRRNVRIIAIINREGSTLARMADDVIYLEAGPEQCVLATKSLTAKLAVLLKLASTNQEKTNQNIRRAITIIERMIEPEFVKERVRPIATTLSKSKDMFVIGRGISYPAALEAALKIKEVTYIHAEGIAAGELKHGTIALIERGTPCIVIALHDEHYDEVISNAMELKSRGAYIIGISEQAESCFDAHIAIPDAGSASLIAAIVAVQLLSYEMALMMGRDPDKPRNLAKSVTVK